MVATGLENGQGKKILQGHDQGIYYCGSGKIGILKKSEGKLTL